MIETRLLKWTLVAVLVMMVYALLSLGGMVKAQGICYPDHDKVQAHLENNLGERLTNVGIIADGKSIVEVYVAADNTSWTMFQVNAKTGVTCLISFGQGWVNIPVKVKKVTM